MEYISLIVASFLFGYFFGHRDLRQEKLLESISNLKEKVIKLTKGRQPVYIIPSNDLPKEEPKDD